MNKKCTLLAAAFMVASAFTASAANPTPGSTVTSVNWEVGNYYYLQTTIGAPGVPYYLSLSGERADSVIVKTAPSSKAAIDSALWEITSAGSETSGPVYQFKNKKTKAILAFAASPTASPILVANGVSKWAFSSPSTGIGTITAYNGGNELTLGAKLLTVDNNNDGGNDTTVVLNAVTGAFTVVVPANDFPMTASDLGDGFSVFQLNFDGTYTGDIFSGKDLLATPATTPDYLNLQVKGDESFPNGTPMYFGVDTLFTEISGATGAYGAKFALDSTYTIDILHTVGNATFQEFKFTADLMNDSLTMVVNQAPTVVGAGNLAILIDDVKVVYASLGSTKVLTVGKGTTQGIAPFITVAKGTPTTISTGSGVYFLRSASKDSIGNPYIVSYENNKIVTEAGFTPSEYLPKGQWYIKDNNGLYSVVDRATNKAIITNQEIFAVNGMANTYTFGSNKDSITVAYQAKVLLSNKYLGSRHFSDAELANNGYALNMASAIADNLYVVTADSVLQAKQSTVADAIAFKLIADTTVAVAGATSLGDTLYQSSYMLKERFSLDSVAYYTSKKGLKLSSGTDTALVFVFHTAATGGKYSISAHGENKELYNVSADGASSNLTLVAGSDIAYFNFMPVAAPTYGSVSDGHKLFMSDGKYLAMNPLNFWAEMKIEGQPIVKADYIMDDFAFWMAKAASSTDAKPLYWISTVDPASAVKDATAPRYYMVSFADSVAANVPGYIDNVNNKNPRVGFVKRDSITIMANSPALFALKTTEDGYWLENQRDLSKNTGKPYVGIVNNVVVMANEGAPFSVESTSGPVDNEEINATEIIVTADVGTVTVQNALGKRVALSNILGQSVGTYQITLDRFTVPALRGVVIVAIEGETAHKVLVK